MRTLIAVPCMDTMDSRFAQCLAMIEKIGDVAVSFNIGSLVYNSRNALARESVKMGADYILWIDSDMMFAPDVLKRLLDDRDKGDIITGLYFRRVAPFSPVLFEKLEITDEGTAFANYDNLPQEQIFEVGGCGFGCVLTPVSVIMDVFAKYRTCFDPLGGVGEDLAFCWRARSLGYKVVCDQSIKLGHVGHTVITRDFYEQYKATSDTKLSEQLKKASGKV